MNSRPVERSLIHSPESASRYARRVVLAAGGGVVVSVETGGIASPLVPDDLATYVVNSQYYRSR
jgi:hypothetical protein